MGIESNRTAEKCPTWAAEKGNVGIGFIIGYNL